MAKDPLLRAFGVTVRALRLRKRLSQEELAERSKLHRTYVSKLECGDVNISLKNLVKLARGLDVTVRQLIDRLE